MPKSQAINTHGGSHMLTKRNWCSRRLEWQKSVACIEESLNARRDQEPCRNRVTT